MEVSDLHIVNLESCLVHLDRIRTNTTYSYFHLATIMNGGFSRMFAVAGKDKAIQSRNGWREALLGSQQPI